MVNSLIYVNYGYCSDHLIEISNRCHDEVVVLRCVEALFGSSIILY